VTDGARRHRQKPDGVAGVPAGLLDHVGEAAEFDTRLPHWIGSADSRPAEVLTLFGAQGERAHLAPSRAG
jgi:hypothetical protein